MIFLDSYRMSQWAYNECLDGRYTSAIRQLITDQFWIYMYCRYVRDLEEMWTKITSFTYANWYYHRVNKRPEMGKYTKI